MGKVKFLLISFFDVFNDIKFVGNYFSESLLNIIDLMTWPRLQFDEITGKVTISLETFSLIGQCADANILYRNRLKMVLQVYFIDILV